ncbi:RNA polymerase sigma factor [Paenibacillus jilunlii]|uniref:RNA polymerase sigma factor n=1 Tax=Paenibacillus jilunlii TaxID=682956 RepID=A0A1G9K978_9BACL|nr:sigma-70 family RNA polymerase sigma factor [Paenibacillus jilunlii]KWX70000.1 RNA polymerase subunit sigma-70 [Paenibacillus jilunlii]SDL46328.1 RNA polymerase sigma-70 factor, ECF subfamily [Paenibacillus jilunlii]
MKDYPIAKERAREMFKEHSSYIYGVALMLTRQRVLADDITQETFLRAFAKFDHYDDSKPLRPWLYRITVNTARNMLRKKSWKQLFTGLPVMDAEDSAEYMAMQGEDSQMLWHAVSRLSLKQREVITLHYYAGLPLPETASALGIPLGTCKSRLHAALEKLRLHCEKEPELQTLKEGLK